MGSLAGKKVAVIRLNIGEVLVKNEQQIIIQTYDHIEEALFRLLSGNADALIFPEPVLWKLAREAGIDNQIKVVGKPLLEVSRAISVAKQNQVLLNRINAAVDTFVGSNEYNKIYTRWYSRPVPYWTVKKVAVGLTVMMIAVIGLMGFWRYRSMMRLNRELSENIEKLSLAEEGLKRAHENLERQVIERTEQLTETVGELEALFNNSQVGIMVLRGERIFYKGNQRLADILGYKDPSEMEGLSMEAFHLNDERFHEFRDTYCSKLSNKEMLQIEYELKQKDGTAVWCTLSGKALDSDIPADVDKGVIWVVDDISKKKKNEIERERLLTELKDALNEVKTLSGLLPICSFCKKIRDDSGYWQQLEKYIQTHTEAKFSHGICKECVEKHYPDLDIYKK
jgi:PAS domain S-box-containing protein